MWKIKEWISRNQTTLLIMTSLLFTITFGGGLLLIKSQQGLKKPPTDTLLSLGPEIVEEENTEDQLEMKVGYADIKGAVVNPGMYEIQENMRVLDLVNVAGGFTEEAKQNLINFSQLIEDQMVIYIPNSKEDYDQWQKGQDLPFSQRKTNSRGEDEAQKINLNLATSQELQQLTGIGEKKAAAIITYREEIGLFKTIEELKNVSGIGQKTFENLQDQIVV